MSVTITVSKDILKDFPQLTYQLFNLASQEEEKEFVYVYTPSGYYRDLTDLLDEYQIPYSVYSPADLALLHVLLIEAEDTLAKDLKIWFEKWGFGSVEITGKDYQSIPNRRQKKISLAIIDNETVAPFTRWEQIKLSLLLLLIPTIFLKAYAGNKKRHLWMLVKESIVIQQPFRLIDLKQAVERLLDIALIPQT